MIFGLSKKGPVAEHEAVDEIERVYHEIKRSLRVSGVNLNFRTWAAHDHFLPTAWDALRSNVETVGFERAADELRSQAAGSAKKLGRLQVQENVKLGESQTFQIRQALDLYHYINPKLLILTSAVRLAMNRERIGSPRSGAQPQVDFGAPSHMAAMEMESDEPDDPVLQQIYEDIKATLNLPSVNSDYRTLALWPDYLSAAWQRLKAVVTSSAYKEATDALRETSRRLARNLPFDIDLSPEVLEAANVDFDKVRDVTDKFEQLLPGLIINIALLEGDWMQGAELAASPFPLAARDATHGGELYEGKHPNPTGGSL